LAESYLPLYRKYRPQRFSDLVGQDTVVKTLSNAIELDKVAHAYLFTGSRGTGKTSTARILAKSLNCVEGPTVNPCGKCPSCIDIANSNSIDVIEIDAASNGSVEAARNLIDKVQFMPVAGKYKIYIIDEVHMLSNQAFNTLLKTLEEPPKNLVFILATTESHKVLTTIISRCQRFDFRRVNQETVCQRLKEIAEKENIKINDKAVSLIARKCNGGMRDALGLLDQASVLSTIQEEITDSDIINLMGSMPEDILFKIADAVAKKDTSSLISLIDGISNTNEPVQVVRELINYFRNCLFIKTADDFQKIKDIISVSETIIPDIKSQTEQFETIELVQIIEKLTECERNLKFSSQQLLWLEVGLVGICHRHDIQVIKDLEERLSRLENSFSSGAPVISKPVPAPKQPVKVEIPKEEPQKPVVDVIPAKIEEEKPEPKPQSVAEKQEIASEQETAENSDNLNENWKKLLENLDSLPAKSFFSNLSTPVEINSEKITLVFKNESFVKQSKETGKIPPLEKAAEKLFGKTPKLTIRTALPGDDLSQKKNLEIDSPSPAAKPQQISTPLSEELKPLPKRGSEVVIDETPSSEDEIELVEELKEISTEIQAVNLSEQAKLVRDLFCGKVID